MGTESLASDFNPRERGKPIVSGFSGFVLLSEPDLYALGVYRRTIVSPDGLIALAEIDLHMGYHCPGGSLKDFNGSSWIGDEKHLRYLNSLDPHTMSAQEITDQLVETRLLVAPLLVWEDRLQSIGTVLLDPVEYDGAILTLRGGVAYYCISTLYDLVDKHLRDDWETEDFLYNGIIPGALYLPTSLRPVFLIKQEAWENHEDSETLPELITIDGQSYVTILDSSLC